MSKQSLFTGRAFHARYDLDAEPTWDPLEVVARLARQSDDLPSFHEAEFMHMGTVIDQSGSITIHQYKHRDTRRYIYLDIAGHAYGREGGAFRRYRSLRDAIHAAELWLFDEHPSFIRTFPPEEWPADEFAV